MNLIVENGETFNRPAMIKEVQRKPLSREFLHVDFYEIDMHRKIVVPIPVVTTGKCKGVEAGGMLQIIRRELEVMCLPTQIPAAIEIDISDQKLTAWQGDVPVFETIVSTGVFKLRNGQAVVVDNTLAPEFKLAPKPEDN